MESVFSALIQRFLRRDRLKTELSVQTIRICISRQINDCQGSMKSAQLTETKDEDAAEFLVLHSAETSARSECSALRPRYNWLIRERIQCHNGRRRVRKVSLWLTCFVVPFVRVVRVPSTHLAAFKCVQRRMN